MRLNVNGKALDVGDLDPTTPLLWVLRDELGLKGTKFGCGAGLCGACTVHIDGEPQRSCSVPISSIGEARVHTIEGISGRATEGSTRQSKPTIHTAVVDVFGSARRGRSAGGPDDRSRAAGRPR